MSMTLCVETLEGVPFFEISVSPLIEALVARGVDCASPSLSLSLDGVPWGVSRDIAVEAVDKGPKGDTCRCNSTCCVGIVA
jgi:hypothetical protein